MHNPMKILCIVKFLKMGMALVRQGKLPYLFDSPGAYVIITAIKYKPSGQGAIPDRW